jgi:ATP-binding cassette subfamily B protein
MNELPATANSSEILPENLRADMMQQLAAHEKISAEMEGDLNAELHFQAYFLVLSNQRIFTRSPDEPTWQSWRLHSGLNLKRHDHAGVGTLELNDGKARLACWRYTLAQNNQAQKFELAFNLALNNLLADTAALPVTDNLCPNCQAPLAPGQEECTVCSVEAHTPPATWVLFRLWLFAQPYKGQLTLGFILTLAATAATMVPPYLTMPLMDKVLIPYQNGVAIDYTVVGLLLAGLLGSALLAWGLGWWRTYILALVSERIGADLRTATYEHLMRLSLEYFGGKRTGDLMTRIGSETDRICLFLSMHLLDFATDVLMIIMTAAVLFSIDPWLALITLIPLPFIGWMIHVVRDKLRTGFEKVDRVWSEVTNVLADTIPGIRVVKAFAQEKR